MHEMTDAKMDNMIYRNVQKLLIAAAKDLAQEPVQSLVEDKTQWKQKEDADRTDDLHLTLTVNKPRGVAGCAQQGKEHPLVCKGLL